MPVSSATEAYRAARDLLLALRDDHGRALAEFAWPRFDGPFNWALDWFDAIAASNDRDRAAHRRGGRPRDARHSFAELARARTRSRTGCAAQGVAPGDRVLLMLGNQVELWETMLAAMKLGAVIIPATAAARPGRPARPHRARRRAACRRCNAEDVGKFDDVPGDYTRIAVGDGAGRAGWRYADVRAGRRRRRSRRARARCADDPLLLYFTSGTTSRPSWSSTPTRRYPVGHLSTMYWIGLQPGDVHLNISSPGWAKHAWSCFFAPWIAEATVFVYNYTRFDAGALLRPDATATASPPSARRRRCGGC